MALWLIRAGSEGEFERKFLDEGRVYLTWDELEDDLTKAKSREAVAEVMRRCLPDAGEGKLRNYVGQIWAFCASIAPGDWFALPSKFASTIHFGESQVRCAGRDAFQALPHVQMDRTGRASQQVRPRPALQPGRVPDDLSHHPQRRRGPHPRDRRERLAVEQDWPADAEASKAKIQGRPGGR